MDSVGTAAIYGLKEDLGLTGYQYSWVGSIMYIGMTCHNRSTVRVSSANLLD